MSVDIQEQIHKAYELRIIFFGATIFSVQIDSQKKKNTIDWRSGEKSANDFSAYTLPEAIRKKIMDFIGRSGLMYGSLDFAVDHDGNYIFLEVNETGQFLWVEDYVPALTLLDCFCEFLIERNRNFIYDGSGNPVRCKDFDDLLTPPALERAASEHIVPAGRAALHE